MRVWVHACVGGWVLVFVCVRACVCACLHVHMRASAKTSVSLFSAKENFRA